MRFLFAIAVAVCVIDFALSVPVETKDQKVPPKPDKKPEAPTTKKPETPTTKKPESPTTKKPSSPTTFKPSTKAPNKDYSSAYPHDSEKFGEKGPVILTPDEYFERLKREQYKKDSNPIQYPSSTKYRHQNKDKDSSATLHFKRGESIKLRFWPFTGEEVTEEEKKEDEKNKEKEKEVAEKKPDKTESAPKSLQPSPLEEVRIGVSDDEDVVVDLKRGGVYERYDIGKLSSNPTSTRHINPLTGEEFSRGYFNLDGQWVRGRKDQPNLISIRQYYDEDWMRAKQYYDEDWMRAIPRQHYEMKRGGVYERYDIGKLSSNPTSARHINPLWEEYSRGYFNLDGQWVRGRKDQPNLISIRQYYDEDWMRAIPRQYVHIPDTSFSEWYYRSSPKQFEIEIEFKKSSSTGELNGNERGKEKKEIQKLPLGVEDRHDPPPPPEMSHEGYKRQIDPKEKEIERHFNQHHNQDSSAIGR